MINRISIIQNIIKVTNTKTYLEIGVNNGACFLRIKCGYKIAVDPAFKIEPSRKLKYFFKNPSNFNNHYFEKTSDDFFALETALLKEKQPKVVLIDGLYTYAQSLRDVLNSLAHLPQDGVIIMHDCNPLTETAAYPADSIDHAINLKLPEWGRVWNGDVWKTIVHLRSFHHELEVFVLDCDHGIGIVRKRPADNQRKFSEQEIQNLTYKDLDSDRKNLINLKKPEFFKDFLKQLA